MFDTHICTFVGILLILVWTFKESSEDLREAAENFAEAWRQLRRK